METYVEVVTLGHFTLFLTTTLAFWLVGFGIGVKHKATLQALEKAG